MATPRKHWFKVADSILRDDLTVEQRGILVGLMAYMNSRWARDGLTGDQACRVKLTRGALIDITGRSQVRYAFSALSLLGQSVSISVSLCGEVVEIYWPKFAEFQGLESGSGETLGKKSPPPRRKTQTQDKEEEESAAEPAAPPLGDADAAGPDPEPPKPKREKPEPPPEALAFAEDFQAALAARNPGYKAPSASALRRWADEARLMLQARPLDEARALARWLFESPCSDAEFWRPNVMSVTKFREKYDQLAAVRRRSEIRGSNPQRDGRGGPPTVREAMQNILRRQGLAV